MKICTMFVYYSRNFPDMTEDASWKNGLVKEKLIAYISGTVVAFEYFAN